MNLYRSFGNLMETWVAERNQGSDSDLHGNNDEEPPIPSSDTGTNLCSESLDSGVETASCDTSFPATSYFPSTDNAETDTFLPDREGDELTPASTSEYPVLSSPAPSSSSSSSPHLCTKRAQEGSNALHLEVEQTLKRMDSTCLMDKPKPLTVEDVLRRRARSSLPPKRHSSELVRSQRSQSCGQRRTVNPSVPIKQMSEMWREQSFMSCDRQRSEDLCDAERKELSPGFRYLEHICQMLEEVARQQMHIQALQMDPLQEDQDMPVSQAPCTCQSDSKAAEEDLSACQRLEDPGNAENSSSEHQQQKGSFRHFRHFRQRSASDTLHLRKSSPDCRGQHLSTFDLLETSEENQEYQERKMEVTNKPNKNWKLKIGSLRRDWSTKSQQMQSPEKKSARRRLSLFFRKRTKAPSE